LPVKDGWPDCQAQHEIARAKAGTHQTELFTGQTSDQVSINRATQKALGDDQTKPCPRHFLWATRAVM